MNKQISIFETLAEATKPPLNVHRQANNEESRQMNEVHKEHFNKQCTIVYEALKRGERLTTAKALIEYGVGDLRRRIKDLIDSGIEIKKEFVDGTRYKQYYL